MDNILQQEAQDLANSLPITESQSWGDAVFMFVAILFGLSLLNRDDETRLRQQPMAKRTHCTLSVFLSKLSFLLKILT